MRGGRERGESRKEGRKEGEKMEKEVIIYLLYGLTKSSTICIFCKTII